MSSARACPPTQKRPVGRKASIDSFLFAKDQELGYEPEAQWGFSSLKHFLDVHLSPCGVTDITLSEALRENIEFFQNLKQQIKQKHKAFEASLIHQKGQTKAQIPVQRSLPITRHMFSRTNSTTFSNPVSTVASSMKHSTRQTQVKDTDHPSKPMTSNSIWQSINKFYSPLPSMNSFKPYLEHVDEKPVSVELGQHYSVTFNQKLRPKFKAEAILLRVPENVVKPVGKIGTTPIISFRRVLAALVVVPDENELDKKFNCISNDTRVTCLEDFEINEMSQKIFPTNMQGTSFYSKMSFEEKLSLEVASLGLNPSDGDPSEIDNEIMEEISSLQQQYRKSAEVTNNLRNMISKILKENHSKMIEHAEKVKQWASLVEKAEKEAKSKPSRPKSRDKLT